MPEITPAKIEWQDHIPVSSEYGDYYFSKLDGLAERQYVFLKHNDLPMRWSNAANKTITIVETGFGAGLNFLATLELWRKSPGEHKSPIHFISVEKHPLTRHDLRKCLSNWPELKNSSDKLLNQYPPLVEGQHLLAFENRQVKLTLIFGDISSCLENTFFTADCWYLDGFSPAKNPQMWQENLFSLIAKRTANNGSFATYTSASSVRKGLAQAGFKVIKQPGFGKKREMLSGFFASDTSIQHRAYAPEQTPLWSLDESIETDNSFDNACATTHDAVVIGSGLAGLTTAYALAAKGLDVAIVERNPSLAKGATGQSQLAMYGKFPNSMNKEFKFTLHCLNYSQRYFNNLQQAHSQSPFWFRSGLLQLSWSANEQRRQQLFFDNIKLPQELVKPVDSVEASKLSHLPLTNGGIWFPGSGWVDPAQFALALTSLRNIKVYLNSEAERLERDDKSGCWKVQLTNKQTISGHHLIICSANDADKFTQTSFFPTKPLRGQVTSIKNPKLRESHCVVCGEGYLCPPVDGWHHFGATFDLNANNTEITETDNTKNIAGIKKWLPEWADSDAIETATINAGAGLRCTTPDYMPIVGKVPIMDSMIKKFAKLRQDSNACKALYGDYHPNLYINIGHGSKGLLTTPICAELISNLIDKSPLPFDLDLKLMVDPARFIVKHLSQRRI